MFCDRADTPVPSDRFEVSWHREMWRYIDAGEQTGTQKRD